MRVARLHDWDMSPTAAIALQRALADRVVRSGTMIPEDVRLIAGVDVSLSKDDPILTAGVVVLDARTLEIVETTSSRLSPPMPYIPGLLSFREIPALIPAIEALTTTPDLFVVDGHGIAHPRRLGIAAHVGLIVDRPTIGVAKTLLCGTFGPLKQRKGSTAPLTHKGEVIGEAVRTRDGVSPVFVSIGNHLDQRSATALALHFARGYRLPEPTRLAHVHVNAMRRAQQAPL